MAGGSSASTNPPKARKRVEADTPSPSASNSLKRAKDGSAFARCEECKNSVPVALIDMHNCSLEAKIKMSLESQVVEQPAEVKKKPSDPKKKVSTSKTEATSESKSKKRKLTKVKDPNMPKRPPTAYFLFMDDFRKIYKEEHPDSKGVKEVAKEAGEKWRSMTEEEKKPYMDKFKELKEEYGKSMEAYNAESKEEEETGDQQAEELCDEDA